MIFMRCLDIFWGNIDFQKTYVAIIDQNKMELLQSQAPAERELLGNSADRTLDIGV